jgi:hypothetical protein
MKVPPALRGLFSAGAAASRALRDFSSAADLCRDLLAPEGHTELLAGETLFVGLFQPVAAGDSLVGALARLDEGSQPAADVLQARQRRIPALINEPARRAAAAKLAHMGDVTAAARDAVAVPNETTVAERPRLLPRQVSARTPTPQPLALKVATRAVSSAHPIVQSRAFHGNDPEVDSSGGTAASSSSSRENAGAARWSGEAAGRELSARMQRAGLTDTWIGSAGEPGVAPTLAPPDESIFDRVFARRLEPAAQTINRRRAEHNAVLPQSGPRLSAVAQTIDEEEAAPVIDPAAATPLRRLAALGWRQSDAKAISQTSARSEEGTRMTRWPSPRLKNLATLRATAQESALPSASAFQMDDREFADRLADVVRQEAIRNGIDPREYES